MIRYNKQAIIGTGLLTPVVDENYNECTQVITSNQLFKIFETRKQDDFWKTIGCVQTSIKAKNGLGVPYNINFYAPLNED